MPYDLTKLERSVIVFEIDDTTFHGHAQFVHALDKLRALHKMQDDVEVGFGSWEGELSTCYVMSSRDYIANKAVVDLFTCQQDAVMIVRKTRTAVIVTGHMSDEPQVSEPLTMRAPISKIATTSQNFTLLKSGMYIAD